jgi:hypothetical protein
LVADQVFSAISSSIPDKPKSSVSPTTPPLKYGNAKKKPKKILFVTRFPGKQIHSSPI